MENRNRSLTEEEYRDEVRKANRKTRIITAVLLIITAIFFITEIVFFFYLIVHEASVIKISLVCIYWFFDYFITIFCIALLVGIVLYTIPNPIAKKEDMIDLRVKYIVYCILLTILIIFVVNYPFWMYIFKI